MSIGADWPLTIMATQDVACGARLWRTAGQLRATLICKATFAVVESGAMKVVAPAGLAITDEHAGGDSRRSCVISTDLVPYRPRGEVFFAGHAHAPNGKACPSVTARLAVVGHRPLIDKSIHVFGERVILENGQSSVPVPFTRMPMVYERTIYNADENPIGMQQEGGAPAPNLVDPQDATSPIGFGPIPSHWPVRKRMLRQLDPAAIGAPIPEIPDAFAWSYFQAAPSDQRCSFFEGNEWLILDGLHPDRPHFETQLPSARAAARLYLVPPGGVIADGSYRPFQLVADTLFVDGDRGLVCLTWRGNLDIELSSIPNLQVLAGLEFPGRTIPWPAAALQEVSSVAMSVRSSQAPLTGVTPISTPVPPASMPPPAPVVSPASAPPIASSGIPLGASDLSTDDGGVRTMYRPADASLLVAAGMHGAPPPPAPVPAEPARVTAPPATDAQPMDVEPEWLEKGGDHEQSTRIASLSAADIERLSAQAAHATERSGQDSHPMTQRRPRFDDPETYQPDSKSFAQIIRDAEASLNGTAPAPRMPLVATPTPSPISVGSGTDAERLAAMARARAAEAAEQGAAAAREHMAGVMRKARPPKTTIRGLNDPNRVDAPVGEAEPQTSRPTVENLQDLFLESTAAGSSAAAKVAAAMASPQATPETTRQIRLDELARSAAGDERRTSPPPNDDEAPAPPLESLDDADDTGGSTKISAGVTEQLAALMRERGIEAPAPIPPPAPVVAPPAHVAPPPTAPPPPDNQEDAGPRTEVAPMRTVDAREEVARRLESGETLAGMSLEGVDLSGLDLARQNLSGARLRGAGLRGVKLDGADLSGSVLDEADLSHTSLDGANLERASLRKAILNGAAMKSAVVTDADFEGAIGTSALFEAVNGERVRFVGARFDSAQFKGASLPGADFSEAIVDGASFDATDLSEARFYEVRGEGASFVGAKLGGARLDSSVLTRARFDAIDAADSAWDQAELDQATFVGAKLAGASFIKSSCREATFSQADLADARFNRAVLCGARFDRVDTASVNFDGADLQGAVLPAPAG